MDKTDNLDARSFLTREHKLLIDGHRCDPIDGGTIDTIDPATGEVLATLPLGNERDVEAAVAAARRAFDGGPWSRLSGDDRARLMWRLGELIDQHLEEFAALDTLDMGAPLAMTRMRTAMAAANFRYYAGYAGKLYGQQIDVPAGPDVLHAYTRLEPVGVVASITPWNGPITAIAGKVAPALAAGCSVVVKPAEWTSLSALRLADLVMEAGFPAGAVNFITGLGSVVGQALADHRGVDKLSFTGSTVTGKKLIRASAGNMKRLTLELGGKSPLIVFADSDPELAIRLAAQAIFPNTGQVCVAGSRLFVEKPIFDRVVEGVAEIAQRLRLGNGFDPETDLGPLVSAQHRERVMGYVEQGIAEGAQLITGGEAVEGRGFFVTPTVFAGTSTDMRIVKEEIFGPVLVAEPFTDVDDVIARANDTSYGLASGIVSGNVGRAHALARRIRAGNVWINCYGATGSHLPFGGMKQSGWGRQFGWEGLEAYLESKTVHVSTV